MGLVYGVSVYFYNDSLILLPTEFLYLFWFLRDVEFVAALAEQDIPKIYLTKIYLHFHCCDRISWYFQQKPPFQFVLFCYNSVKIFQLKLIS